MPPLPFFRQHGPVTGKEWEDEGMRRAFLTNFVIKSGLYVLGTDQLERRLSVIAGFIQISSSQFPHLEPLQVPAGCQAGTQEAHGSYYNTGLAFPKSNIINNQITIGWRTNWGVKKPFWNWAKTSREEIDEVKPHDLDDFFNPNNAILQKAWDKTCQVSQLDE